MRTPPSTGHHQESNCFCFVCFCQINLGGASGLVACARMAIITLYSVLHYIVLVSLASTTRRKRSLLTLEKKLEIIGELKKGKSLRCVSGLYHGRSKGSGWSGFGRTNFQLDFKWARVGVALWALLCAWWAWLRVQSL